MAFMNPTSTSQGPIHVIHVLDTSVDGLEGSFQRGALQLPRGIKKNQRTRSVFVCFLEELRSPNPDGNPSVIKVRELISP